MCHTRQVEEAFRMTDLVRQRENDGISSKVSIKDCRFEILILQLLLILFGFILFYFISFWEIDHN